MRFLDLTRGAAVPMWVRRVVVPGLNDTAEDIASLTAFLTAYPNTVKVELLPFRKLCLEKYEALGIPFPLKNTPELSAARLAELTALLPVNLR